MTQREIRILVFDESSVAISRLEERLSLSEDDNVSARVLPYYTHSLTSDIQQEIGGFRPDLVILDFVKGRPIEYSFEFVEALSALAVLRAVPIIIVSARINGSAEGRKTHQRCMEASGVVAAFSKLPNYPSKQTLVDFMTRRTT